MATHLTERERYVIEFELSNGCSVSELATKLGRSRSCIYREIKRGRVELVGAELVPYQAYKADVGQRVRVEHCRARGIGRLNIGNDIRLANRLERLIKQEGYSPYAAMQVAAMEGHKVRFCLSTLYNYIRGGVFLALGKKDLHKHKVRNEKDKTWKRGCTLPTIEDRPSEIESRTDFGHWEMDTVVSGKNQGACLLVLTERKTRFEIIRKMRSKSIDSTLLELDKLQDVLGGSWNKIFKTITTDNGSEFLGNGVLTIGKDGRKRFDQFRCHPYCSGERGSNENQNRFIRRYVPKGSDISKISTSRIVQIQNFINDYPRKMFGGCSSSQMFFRELGC